MSRSAMKTVSLFGATGSVGRSTADLLRLHDDSFVVDVLTGHNNLDVLLQLAQEFKPQCVVVSNTDHFSALKAALFGTKIRCLAGQDGLLDAAGLSVDIGVHAITGMAGLGPLFANIGPAQSVAIANKEPLVSAGPLLLQLAHDKNVKILPLDSEHNAIFQVFEQQNRDAVERLILTASGGPFRERTLDELRGVTKENALNHPNWSMGAKISIDSATMMNKALEVIEACYLFEMPPEKVDVLLHPQSIVHSMVQYVDGSVLSQMGASDMRTPITYALGWPARIQTSGGQLDLLGSSTTLHFEAPDFERFTALPLAYECLSSGPEFCIALNAANEVAVEAFLNDSIAFIEIMDCVHYVIKATNKAKSPIETLDKIIEVDRVSRQKARSFIQKAR